MESRRDDAMREAQEAIVEGAQVAKRLRIATQQYKARLNSKTER